jgi:hypothetical protein
VPIEMAMARMIENNAFIVLNHSFLTARMGLPNRCSDLEVKKNKPRTYRP